MGETKREKRQLVEDFRRFLQIWSFDLQGKWFGAAEKCRKTAGNRRKSQEAILTPFSHLSGTGMTGHRTMEMIGRSTASYLVRTPRVPFFMLVVIGLEGRGLLAFQGRRGIASVVRWNLRPVIFGVEFSLSHYKRCPDLKLGLLFGCQLDHLASISGTLNRLKAMLSLRYPPRPRRNPFWAPIQARVGSLNRLI